MMLDSRAPDRPAAAPLSLLLAAELQDSLMAAGRGDAVVGAAPPRRNPVTRDEMEAGSIELF